MSNAEAGWDELRADLLARVSEIQAGCTEAEEKLARLRRARAQLVHHITTTTPISQREVARHLDISHPAVAEWVRSVAERNEVKDGE